MIVASTGYAGDGVGVTVLENDTLAVMDAVVNVDGNSDRLAVGDVDALTVNDGDFVLVVVLVTDTE